MGSATSSTSSSLSTGSRAELRKIQSFGVWAASCPLQRQPVPLAQSRECGRGCGRMNPHAAAPLSKRALDEDFRSLLPSISMKLQFFYAGEKKKALRKQSFGTFLKRKIPFFLGKQAEA